MPGSNPQQVFNLQLAHSHTFDTFYSVDNTLTELLKSNISRESKELQLFIWGHSGSGKTHLLQAVCDFASKQNTRAIYVPLHKLRETGPQILEGFEAMQIICIDDIDAVAGQEDWEQALLLFINELRDKHRTILITAKQNPTQNIFAINDLNSRMTWGPVYMLPTLTNDELDEALNLHADARGMQLTKEVRSYLFKHCRRDVPSLVGILEVLDHASLQEQRKVTVPFLKETIFDR